MPVFTIDFYNKDIITSNIKGLINLKHAIQTSQTILNGKSTRNPVGYCPKIIPVLYDFRLERLMLTSLISN